jgi:hypothetical protein
VVNRGPSLASCSAAIAASIEADAKARGERQAAHERWREDAMRAVMRRPERVALIDPRKVSARRSE